MKLRIIFFITLVTFLSFGLFSLWFLFHVVFQLNTFRTGRQEKPFSFVKIPKASSVNEKDNVANDEPDSLLNVTIPHYTTDVSLQSYSLTISVTNTLRFEFTPTITLQIPTNTIKPSSTPKSSSTPTPPSTPTPTVTAKPTLTSTITPTSSPLPFHGSLLISEVMIYPSDSQAQSQWIEIANPNHYPVDLTHFKIGDEETSKQREGMYFFPEGTVILPGQLFVVAVQAASFYSNFGFLPNAEIDYTIPSVPKMKPYETWSKGRINLNPSGDEVILMDGANMVLDYLCWGNSSCSLNLTSLGIKKSTSLERFPSFSVSFSNDVWRLQHSPNPGKTASYPTSTPTVITLTPTPTFTSTDTPSPTSWYTAVPNLNLYISEIYFPKIDENPFYTWIKICNPDSILYASIENISIGDNENLDNTEGLFKFPPKSEIGPSQCVLIAYHANKFSALYQKKPDYELQDTDSSVTDLSVADGYTINGFSLDPKGDELILFDEGLFPIDSIGWGSYLNTPKFDKTIEPGCSLKRKLTDQDQWTLNCNPDPNNDYPN